ncbi:MAG: methionyl-tRNA formyltransferase, partial [Clostridia bacterium]
LLPKYRGSSPIQWAVINGEKQTGITIMKTALGIDSGDILLQKVVDILPKETAGQLFDRLALEGAKTLAEALKLIQSGQATYIAQDERLATHFPMLTKGDGKIDWTKSTKSIAQLVLGLNPWPSAYSFCNGKMLKIWDVDIVELSICNQIFNDNSAFANSPCGQTLVSGDQLFVRCGDGIAQLNEVQLEGKKRMPAKEFLCGYNKANGFVLE